MSYIGSKLHKFHNSFNINGHNFEMLLCNMDIFQTVFHNNRSFATRYYCALRAVQTKAILFLKSVGSDIERLRIWIVPSSIDFESIYKLNFKVVLCRIRLFPKLISKIKWLRSAKPINWSVNLWPERFEFQESRFWFG